MSGQRSSSNAAGRSAGQESFAEKNARRKQGRTLGTHSEQLEARRRRRALRGTFGHARASDYNDMVAGTTGEFRTEGR